MVRRRRAAALLMTAGVLLQTGLGARQAAALEVTFRPTTLACPVEHVTPTEDVGYLDTAGTTFEREITCLADHAITYGRSPVGFGPRDPVSRRQMALFLSRLLLRGQPPSAPPASAFTDTAHLDAGTRAAIETVAAHGIAGGKGDGRFAPDEAVTRGQMARFVNQTHAALAGQGFQPAGRYFDDSMFSVHADAIEAIAHAGIAGGVDPRRYDPERPVSRGQMAGFLARLLDIEVEAGRVESAYPNTPEATSSTGQRCTIVGTPHEDELVGTPEADVICGRGGDDRLSGRGGDDVVDGGAGNDTLDGDFGADHLLGGLGDDLLEGGAGADLVDGEEGSDVCLPSSDEQRSCSTDAAAPRVVSVEYVPAVVDVTAGDVEVTLRLHLTDDVAVLSAWPDVHVAVDDGEDGRSGPSFSQPVLVSGTAADGIWEATGLALRHSEPAMHDVDLEVYDRALRKTSVTVTDALDIRTSQPDRTPPVVESASVGPATGGLPLDVRSGNAAVVVEARITDDLSGVAQSPYLEGRVWGQSPPKACLDYPQADGQYRPYGGCASMELVSGDVHDGLHRVTMAIGQGAPSGDWNLRLVVSDRVGSAQDNGESWLGPDAYQRYLDAGWNQPHVNLLPGGAGRFPVQSTGTTAVPTVTEATVAPASVDSSSADQLVSVTVRARDADGDLAGAHAFLDGDGSVGSPTFEVAGIWHVSGDGADALWRTDFVVQKGTPPGNYHLRVFVRDAAAHSSVYVSRLGPPAEPGEQLLPGPGTVTVTS